MWLMVLIVLWACPGFAGTCQEIGGAVRYTDDVGRDPTLQSLYKALDIKPQDQGREGKGASSQSDEDSQKTSLQGPSPKGRVR